jgi:hypothetical protein
MERGDLYENDLTEEDLPSPADGDITAHSLKIDPDILPSGDDGDGEIGKGEPMPPPTKTRKPAPRKPAKPG